MEFGEQLTFLKVMEMTTVRHVSKEKVGLTSEGNTINLETRSKSLRA